MHSASISPLQNANSNIPVHGLPAEVLEAVFLCYAQQTANDFNDHLKSGTLLPSIDYNPRIALINLTSVCQHWRHMACGFPKLWKTCWLSYVRPELNIIWLGRAKNWQEGQYELHLNGSIPPPPTYKHHCNENAFISSIIPYASQWSSLTLYPEAFALDEMPVELRSRIIEIEHITPRLQSIHTLLFDLNPNTYRFMQIAPWLLWVIQNCSQLKHLEIPILPVTLPVSQLNNLSRLHVHYLNTAEQLYKILTNAPLLEALVVGDMFNWSWVPSILGTVVHTRLTEFGLHPHTVKSRLLVSGWFPFIWITLPSLTKLKYPVCLGLVRETDTALCNFLAQSGCALEELEIRFKQRPKGNKRLRWWPSGLMDVLYHDSVYPTLQVLCLTRSQLTLKIIETLNIETTTGGYNRYRVCGLKELRLRHVEAVDADVDQGMIPNIVASRLRLGFLKVFEYTNLSPGQRHPHYLADKEEILRLVGSREDEGLSVLFDDE